MATQFDTQLNWCAEGTYGTYASSGARSLEFNNENFAGIYDRVVSMGLRKGRMGLGERNSLPVAKGCNGGLDLHVPTKGFGAPLSHAMGSVSLGSPSGGKTTQTHTIGTLVGKSSSIQVYRQFSGSTSGTTFTYTGCKVTDMELSCDVDGLLTSKFNFDGRAEATGTALVSAAYPTGQEPFVWASMAVTVAGASFCATGWSLKLDNGLKTDRFKICSTTKDEPVEVKDKAISLTIKGAEFTDATTYGYVKSATNAGMFAEVVITCTGQTDTANLFVITLPKVRIDSGIPNVSQGNLLLEQPLAGVATWPDAGGSPMTIAYTSTDSSA